MKKTMIFAAAAAMFMFASCQKEEVISVQDSQAGELVFTATIDQSATKTTINTDGTSANKGKVSWEVNDSISVTDGADTAVYYIAEVGDIAADGSATFTYKSGIRPSASAASYTASYGTAITTVQTYSATAGKLPMTGVSDSGDKTKLNFTVTCGLLKLNLTASGETTKDISKIEIVGRLAGAAKDTLFALTCDNEPIESAKDFYIALPAGDYTLMKFTNSKGSVCFKKATTAMAIEANKIQPVTLSGITFSAVLPGEFTVASDKQVQFSASNLWCNASASPVTYSFESAQNVTYSTLVQSAYTASHVCHFLWTKTAANSYAVYCDDGTCTTTDKFFADGSDADHSLTIDGQSGLYALTGGDSGEWNYLFTSRDNASGLHKYGVSVTTSAGTVANCLVIAPDGYTGSIESSYDAAAWATAESNGLVCLPAAGMRNGSTLFIAGSAGYYWSATPHGLYTIDAYDLYFNGSNVGPSNDFVRNYGFSVRLVYSAAPSAPVYPEAPGLACVKIGDVWWAPVNCGYDATHTYGSLYQWGRKYGQYYEAGTLALTDMNKADDTETNKDKFGKYDSSTYNWFSGDVDNTLWNSSPKGASDPCPTGWRVPTEAEFTALISEKAWRTNTVGTEEQSGYWFNGSSAASEGTGVFLPAAGYRIYSNGSATDRGSYGIYWSSSVNGYYGRLLRFNSGSANMDYTNRALGYSVRCVQE